jgi:preprotein translocase subunit SecF
MNIVRRFYRSDYHIDFLGRRNIGFVLSAVLIVVSLGSLVAQGLNLGIEFRGGVAWEVPAPGVSVGDARDVLDPLGQQQARVQTIGNDVLRVQTGTLDDDVQAEVTDALADLAGVDRGEININEVGPSWGDQITEKAVRALVFFFLLIAAYISLRFSWKMAIAALIAVVHDVLVTVGVYSVLQLSVTPATVIAFLTILGYSLYDTIVVFDKVQENEHRMGRESYTTMVNRSMNEVFTRSINTTVTSLMPVISLLVVGSLMLGAVTLQEFALALLIGLITGAYSSIFTASPVLAILKEREPRYAARAGRDGAGRPVLTPSARRSAAAGGTGGTGVLTATDEADGDDGGGDERPARPAPAPPAGYRGGVAPRGRKKGKRR